MSEPPTPSEASPWVPADPPRTEPAAGDPATPVARWVPAPTPAPPAAGAPPAAASAPAAADAPAPVLARPAPPAPLPPSGRRTGPLGRELAVPAWLAALTGVTLVAAALACVILATSNNDTPAAPAPATALVRALRDPFELDGVRWATFVSPSQPWTAFAGRVSPGPGNRWLLVAVRVRNLSRGRLDPAALGYAVVDDAGRRITPDPQHSTAPGSGTDVPVGSPGQVDLAFRVPARATQLHLRFATRPRGGTAIDVPLGAS